MYGTEKEEFVAAIYKKKTFQRSSSTWNFKIEISINWQCSWDKESWWLSYEWAMLYLDRASLESNDLFWTIAETWCFRKKRLRNNFVWIIHGNNEHERILRCFARSCPKTLKNELNISIRYMKPKHLLSAPCLSFEVLIVNSYYIFAKFFVYLSKYMSEMIVPDTKEKGSGFFTILLSANDGRWISFGEISKGLTQNS